MFGASIVTFSWQISFEVIEVALEEKFLLYMSSGVMSMCLCGKGINNFLYFPPAAEIQKQNFNFSSFVRFATLKAVI